MIKSLLDPDVPAASLGDFFFPTAWCTSFQKSGALLNTISVTYMTSKSRQGAHPDLSPSLPNAEDGGIPGLHAEFGK